MRSVLGYLTAPGDGSDLIIKSEGGEFTVRSPLRPEIADLSGLLNVLIQFIFPFAAVIFFLMIVYAGFVYVTSQGDAGKLSRAQAAITSALLGLALLFVAYFVIRIIAGIFGFEGGILPSA